MTAPGRRCRHAFEAPSVHANGDVVCSIIDGRGDGGHRRGAPGLPRVLAERRGRGDVRPLSHRGHVRACVGAHGAGCAARGGHAGAGVWQYVVFRWNDDDRHLARPRAMAADLGVPIWSDFAHTWGRSRPAPDELRGIAAHLRPFTALPGEPRQQGW